MSSTFEQEIAPLVEEYHALGAQHKLSLTDMQTFATKLENIFQTMDPPARHIFPWGYMPDSEDSEENTLGNSGIDPFPPDALTAPTSEDEIIAIVKKAYAECSQVRVIGAAHSSPSNIILDAPHGVFPPNVTLITLTKYRGVSIDKDNNRAIVKAGTNIDVDPQVPDSTPANSLAQILQAAGYALPETGGIAHQTIGGFLATGSAGGSLKYSFHDAVYGFTLIDGTGTKHTLSRDDSDLTLFFAAGVSAGLCGIITDVTLTLTPTFWVTGTQQASPIQPLNPDWLQGCPVNLYGPSTQGVPGVEDYFKDPNNEYLYWPQPDLPPRVQIWTGKRCIPNQLPRVKYMELDVFSQIGAMTALWVLWQFNYYRDVPIIGDYEKEIAGKILDLFLPTKTSVPFADDWFNVLPMDNAIHDNLVPSCFAEFWFDMDRAADAVSALKALNLSDSSTIGNFFTEIYCAKQSPFWLSPSFTGDKFRLDVNFFQYDTLQGSSTERADPTDFFRTYFEYFDKNGPPYRCHLGKYMTPAFGDLHRLRSMYPKYDEWMKVRQTLDPHQIFVTPYWRNLYD